ncbi:S8 family peptidase [Sphingomonas sp.]|uniref:S8 family peptidase n=1 Tax=Sphingomonas sp. TaxID=28214 RepID=UPI0035C84D63
MQPIRSGNDTAEFRRNYGANEFVNALYALDSGHTGQGVTVAVIDDGALDVAGELTGRISPLSKDFGYVTAGGVKTKRDELGSSQSDHGTAVANIIAGNRNGNGPMGYAPNAMIAVLRIADWDADAKKETLTHVVEALDYAAANGIKLVNHSLGSGGGAYMAIVLDDFAKSRALFVSSAGNETGDSPGDASELTDRNRRSILFVGALSPAITGVYQLEAYSNRAGTAMDRYVVAPGQNVTTGVNGSTIVFGGTSSAAPVVSALAATILSKWPQLTGQDAGDIILNTAKDLGAPGVDPIFGHGLVDFKAALSPVNPTLSNGVASGSIDGAVMAVPAQVGIGAIQTALSSVTVLDDFGRDFRGSVAGLVVQPQVRRGHWLRRRVEDMNAGAYLTAGAFSSTLGYTSTRVGPDAGDVRTRATAGNVAFIGGGWSARAAWNRTDASQSDVMGLAALSDGVLAYAPLASNSFGIDRYRGDGSRISATLSFGGYDGARASAATLGWAKGASDLCLSLIDEDGTFLGMPTGAGALRLGSGATTALLEAHRVVGGGLGWTLELYGSAGITRLKIARASLVTGATPLLGSRFGVQAGRDMLHGRVTLGIAQPLAIEAGAARLTFGSGYDLALQRLTYSTTSASLAGRRRVQLSAGYATGGVRSSLRMGVASDADDGSVSALAGWRATF